MFINGFAKIVNNFCFFICCQIAFGFWSLFTEVLFADIVFADVVFADIVFADAPCRNFFEHIFGFFYHFIIIDGVFAVVQFTNDFNINIIMDCHCVCHISQSGFIGKHIMGVILVVNGWFSKIYFITVFTTQIQIARVFIFASSFIFSGKKCDGTHFFEHLKNIILEKIIVGFNMMSY